MIFRDKESPSIQIVETDVIPIALESDVYLELALLIKEELNYYKDFYKEILAYNDGICLGDFKGDYDNPLLFDSSRILPLLEISNDTSLFPALVLKLTHITTFSFESEVCI